ncbi:MAG: carbon-nitrogen hydrolase family protein [Bacteroidales bacterium]|nr:carbon-nitrogen hydrolase family protein [Bacteroidales bacterium]MBN2756366.1 carbon-nitrogen hydrolase family protein [Bacteroidales bacterium]
MKVKVCVIQDTPVFFNKIATMNKVEILVKENAEKGCKLIVFPESFIPGYPRGFSFGTIVGSRNEQGRKLYKQYYDNSFDIESDDIKILEKISAENDAYIIIGVTEKNKTSGSLYCSLLYISPTKGLLGVHRKIKPTGQERVIWAEDSGASLFTCSTKIGKLGGLICWENYIPLARMAMYNKGVEIYVAPTADARPNWTSTMQHIALEGRCFVLGANQYFKKSDYPKELRDLVQLENENICEGGSVIVSPNGDIIAGPVFGKKAELIAEIDLDNVIENKLDFDVIGHYSRNDIFEFNVINQPEIKEE